MDYFITTTDKGQQVSKDSEYYEQLMSFQGDKIEKLSRANTLLTLQNEALEGQVLLLMDDIDVLNSVIKEQVI